MVDISTSAAERTPFPLPKLMLRQCHDGADTLCEPYDYALYGAGRKLCGSGIGMNLVHSVAVSVKVLIGCTGRPKILNGHSSCSRSFEKSMPYLAGHAFHTKYSCSAALGGSGGRSGGNGYHLKPTRPHLAGEHP